MNKKAAAIIAAALTAACGFTGAIRAGNVPTTVTARAEGMDVASAFNARADELPCEFIKADQDIDALSGSRCAYVSGETFLYIDADGVLLRRADGADSAVITGASAITHVDGDYAYVLLAGEDTSDSESDDHGWGEASSEYSAPDTGRELSAAVDWVKVSISSGESAILLSGITSVPIISGGYAYALNESGELIRGDLSGNSEVLYSPADSLTELRLSPAPGGIICARYEEGLQTGCAFINAECAQSAPYWAANARFFSGYALNYFSGEHGSGRSGLYIFSSAGEQLIDEYASDNYEVLDGLVYYWHADPEQAYGFTDLMAFDPTSNAIESVPSGAELRAHLFIYDNTLYLTNYDSELYVLTDSGIDYAMDLTVDYSFDSDIMPDVTLFSNGDSLCALIYVDEGNGEKFAGEVAG